MRHVLRPVMLSAALTLAAAGCTTEQQWTRTVQPVRTLDEIYALQDQVNENARSFDLGSGDAVGRHTTRISRWVAARQD